MRIPLIVFAVLFAVGCAPTKTEMEACPPEGCPHADDSRDPYEPQVRQRATFDLQCPAGQITIKALDDSSFARGPWGARGCGRQATYIYQGDTVILNSAVQQVH